MEPLNCTVHVRPDGCDVWTGAQVVARAQATAAQVTGLPLEKVAVHNHYLGGGFGRRLELDYVTHAVQIAKQVDGPVKVVWTREEDIQHDIYRPYYHNRISAGLDARGLPVAWRPSLSRARRSWHDGYRPHSRMASIATRRWHAGPPYACPNVRVEYVRLERLGVPAAFWRGVGPTHTVFVVESFIDELADAAKQDPVAYRRALLDDSPRARAVLDLAAEKAGWGQPLPDRVADAESPSSRRSAPMSRRSPKSTVGKDGTVRVERVVCAVDAG